MAMGAKNWWVTTYRCHALALLLGATPNEIMAELYGRSTGNAKGRGGSMHLYTDRLLGGFGIVGGQVPVATGAAFTLKYQENKKEIAICFLGDGAVPQGAVHEAWNLAALWDLPCMYVIENNEWGMGTHVERAVSVPRLAEDKAPGYGMRGYTVDGMDFLACYAAFKELHRQMLKDSRPILIEVMTQRFRGHSISDPGLYRSKEELKECMQLDPIESFKGVLEEEGLIDDERFKEMNQEKRKMAQEAMKYADSSPWPSLDTLEKDVFAP
jgi:pyruvate dehydrogenase E1 component alpha subunit